MTPKHIFLSIIAAIFIFFGLNSLFVINEQEQAIVVQFGDPKRVVQKPGLHLKMPFLQNVIFYDSRILTFNPSVEQVILNDQKRLDVDSFVEYKIVDPLKFFQTVKTELVFKQRLALTLNSALRGVLGRVNLTAVLSDKRIQIMEEINALVAEAAKRFGVEIVDVRIKRADLPSETSEAIFRRMRSEREQEAAEFRATGKQQAQEIRAMGEKEAIVIVSEANKRGKTLKGEGDKVALEIIGKAAASDPEFYRFFRSLEAYKSGLKDDQTSYVLSPDNQFLKYFKKIK